jgi:hypothetical protein
MILCALVTHSREYIICIISPSKVDDMALQTLMFLEHYWGFFVKEDDQVWSDTGINWSDRSVHLYAIKTLIQSLQYVSCCSIRIGQKVGHG